MRIYWTLIYSIREKPRELGYVIIIIVFTIVVIIIGTIDVVVVTIVIVVTIIVVIIIVIVVVASSSSFVSPCHATACISFCELVLSCLKQRENSERNTTLNYS